MLVNNSALPSGFSQTLIPNVVKVLCFDTDLRVLIPRKLLGQRHSGKSVGTGRAGGNQRVLGRFSRSVIAHELRHVQGILRQPSV